MNTKNLLLKIQYDGTAYHGYQIQPEAITVQKVLEDTLTLITGEIIKVNGCSRTDAGVHACEYACSFVTGSPIPPERIPIVLNSKLPCDIKALSCTEVSPDFHARFDTKSKTYRYIINTDKSPDVFGRNFQWQIKKTLDVSLMQKACKYFLGEHDFSSFMTTGNDVTSTIRSIYELYVEKKDELVVIYIRANGYLYNMVRIITGTLTDVGLGKYPPEKIAEIIDACDRACSGPTAPPQGLALYKVEY